MKRRAWLYLLAAAALPALAADPAPEGRNYTPGEFSAIDISGSAAVRFTQGPSEQVFVEGGEEAQKSVQLDVHEGTLFIRPAGGWKFWNSRRVQLSVTARELRKLMISGAADVVATGPVQIQRLDVSISGAGLARFDKLRGEQLRFHVSGAGDGQMAGSVNELAVSVSGRSEFRGEQLQCERANVQVSGIGDVKVWVTQNLAVTVSGVGTVDYWGTPQLSRRSAGIARINDRGPKSAAP
jgi:hypothetical protein